MAQACLLDTNILLRIGNREDPRYFSIADALNELAGRGCRLCHTSQSLAEFWNVSTRPVDDVNGFGLSVAATNAMADVVERDFEFLADSREVHQRWRRLLIEHDVKGVQVHDARLAASMYVHGVGALLTFNGRDFKRYTGLQILHPAEVARWE